MPVNQNPSPASGEAVLGPQQASDLASLQEKALVCKWRDLIEQACEDAKEKRKEWKKWRDYVAGSKRKNWKVDTNLIQSTISALLPHIYARDPDIQIRPKEQAQSQSYRMLRAFSRTAEIVVQSTLERANLKYNIKRQIRGQMTCGLGWVKVSPQIVRSKDPIIERRIADVTDNLERIAYLIRQQHAQGVSSEELEANQSELQNQIQALQAQVEVDTAEGMVIDYTLADDMVVDPALRNLEDYRFADWMAQRIWYTYEGAQATFSLTDAQMVGAKTYSMGTEQVTGDVVIDQGPPTTQQNYGTQHTSGKRWVAVWEIWDKRSSTVLTWVEGMETWARPPMPPVPSSERFYPFFMYAQHWVDGQRWPMSDVEMWHKLQDEFASRNSKRSKHVERSMPARIANKSTFDPKDAAKIQDAALQELVLVDIPPSVPVQNAIGTLLYAPIDEALYETQDILQQLEQVSGLQDANRGAVTKTKTATEAQIMQAGLATRITERQDVIEDMIAEIALYVLEIGLSGFSPQYVATLAGQGAMWPQLSKADIFGGLDVSIRAGSTGKPNLAQEQQAWATLLPIIKETATQVVQMRATGQHGLADTMLALLKETVRRSDDRLDVDQFIPPPAPPPPPVPVAKDDDIQIRNGSMTIDEARQHRGLPPLPGNLGAVPLVYTKNGAIPLSTAIAQGTPVPSEIVPPMAGSGPSPIGPAPNPLAAAVAAHGPELAAIAAHAMQSAPHGAHPGP